MRNRWLCALLIVLVIFSFSSCKGTDGKSNDSSDETTVEEVQEEGDLSKDEDSSHENEVTPSFDEDGNPTGEYAEYLWEQQQLEEARNSMAEEAIKSMQEDDYMDDYRGFPY